MPALRTDRWGIDSGYEDCAHEWRVTPEATRRALLKGMRVDPASRPPAARVRVIRRGKSTGLTGPGELQLEDGRAIPINRDGAAKVDLPLGYHDFRPARGAATRLIVTPARCYLPRGIRLWGWAAQLYALRSKESWGIGDLEDLRTLAEWSAAKLRRQSHHGESLGCGVAWSTPAAKPLLPE